MHVLVTMCLDFGFRCSVNFFFVFKQKTAYEMRISDWSSDVCSSDLAASIFRSLVAVQLQSRSGLHAAAHQGCGGRAARLEWRREGLALAISLQGIAHLVLAGSGKSPIGLYEALHHRDNQPARLRRWHALDRKSTRLNSSH